MSESHKICRLAPAWLGWWPALSVAVAMTIGVAGCSTVPVTGRKAVSLVSETEVTKMSLAAFEEAKKRYRLSHDRKQIELLQRVGNRIAEVVFWDIPNAQWEFVVFDSPAQVNAFAMAGGKVGVFSGIFEVATTEDELAVVLAHEIAHVAAKHTHEKLSQEMLRQAGGFGLAVGTGGGYYAAQAVMLAYGIGSQVVGLGFDRGKEREADRMGLIYMAKAGYDPEAAIRFWNRMDEVKSNGLAPSASLLSSHPSHADRLFRLREALPAAKEIYEKAKASEVSL